MQSETLEDDIIRQVEKLDTSATKFERRGQALLAVDDVREIRRLRELGDSISGFAESEKEYKRTKAVVKKIHEVCSFVESKLKILVSKYMQETSEDLPGVQTRNYPYWEVDRYNDIPGDLFAKCEHCHGTGNKLQDDMIDEIVKTLGEAAKIPGIVVGKKKVVIIRNTK